MRSRMLLSLIGLLSWLGGISMADPLGTAFTYQGRLSDGVNPAQGIYDLRFTVYDAPAGGNSAAGPLTNAAVAVTKGYFTVSLDFGSGVFAGNARWLELGVRTNGGSAFVTLAPRQALTSWPYALYVPNAGAATTATTAASANSVAAANVSGTLALSQLPGAVVTNTQTGITLGGTFSGNGSGLTNLNATQLASGTVADGRLSANAALLNTNQVFTGSNRFAGVVSLTNAANTFAGTFSGTGASLTNLNGAAITSGTISSAQLAAGAVTSASIADGSVTLADLAANSVDSSKIVDGSITSADLASEAALLAKVSGGAMAVTGFVTKDRLLETLTQHRGKPLNELESLWAGRA